MQKTAQKPNFPHFLRKCSESIRIALQFNISGSNQAIFLSNFILSAEKMRKTCWFLLVCVRFSCEKYKKNNGLTIRFSFIPNYL